MADAAGGQGDEDDWEEWDSGDWVAGTGVGTARAGAGALAEAGSIRVLERGLVRTKAEAAAAEVECDWYGGLGRDCG